MSADPFGWGMYSAPPCHPPSATYLAKIATRLGFDMSEDEIAEYRYCMEGLLLPYQRVFQMSDPGLPSRYPRSPGYRPSAEENPYNAWYYKTEINGKSSGRLAGKKLAIQDNVAVAGVPMMNGSKLMEGYIPEFDATVVSRVLDDGGKIVGKAVCEDLCLSGSSYTSATGPVLNPHDKTRTAGGSSSGTAVLVAVNEVDMGVGGDQGGSLRIPASWCGIVGIKPTHGLVPYTGAMPVEMTVDHIGAMGRTVTDCATLLEVIAGFDDCLDPRQPYNFQVPQYSKSLTGKIDGLKIGVVQEGFEMCEPDVAATVQAAAKSLSKAGATVQDISVPMHRDGEAIWTPICLEGAYESIIRNAGFGPSWKGFHSISMLDHLTKAIQTRINEMSPVMKLFCLAGEYLKEANNHRFYAKACNLTANLTAAYEDAFSQYDVLVMPTIPFKSPELPPADVTLPEYVHGAVNMISNTAPFNVTGHPAVSINAGKSAEGLPIGMQLVGKHFDETTLLNTAFAFEKLSG